MLHVNLTHRHSRVTQVTPAVEQSNWQSATTKRITRSLVVDSPVMRRLARCHTALPQIPLVRETASKTDSGGPVDCFFASMGPSNVTSWAICMLCRLFMIENIYGISWHTEHPCPALSGVRRPSLRVGFIPPGPVQLALASRLALKPVGWDHRRARPFPPEDKSYAVKLFKSRMMCCIRHFLLLILVHIAQPWSE